MQIAYDVTRDDLYELQLQLVRRSRSSPVRLAVPLLLGVPISWLMAGPLLAANPLLAEPLPRAVAFLLLYGVAAAAAVVIWRRVASVGFPPIDRWAARRMTDRALSVSVLGPMRVSFESDGLVRSNSSGERTIPWSDVKELLRSKELVIVRLHGPLALPIPTRAFADSRELETALARLESLTGRRHVAVGPDAGEPPRPLLRPLLMIALAAGALLLAWDRWLPWYYDPRPGNPDDRIIVYATDWCGVCARLRGCLAQHQIPFEERNVEDSPRANAEFWALDGDAVPLVLAGRTVVTGMPQEALQSAMAKAGYRLDCWSESAADLPAGD